MTNLPKRPRDTAQLAKLALDMATGEVENDKEQVLVEALHAQEQPPAGRAKSAQAARQPKDGQRLPSAQRPSAGAHRPPLD